MLNSYLTVVLIFLKLLTIVHAKPPRTSSEGLLQSKSSYELHQDGSATKQSEPSENSFINKSSERGQSSRKRWRPLSSEYSDQDIIFPDAYDLLFDTISLISGPPKCAEGQIFCENVDFYPYHHIRDMVKKNPMYKDLFGKDEASIEISNRVGGDQPRFFCGSTVSTIYPQIGKNKNNKWKFIVNQKEEEDGIVQGLLIETCRKPNTPCDIVGELPMGYTSSCTQKYIYRRLLALNGSGAIYPDSFQIPTACCCSYKRNVEFLARFGAPVTPTNTRRIYT